jgi:hypothetical protein
VLATPLAAGSVPRLLPAGLWLDGNPYTAKGAPSRREGKNWSFREDRLAWPAAVAWSREHAGLRPVPPRAGLRETELPLRRGYRYTGAYHFDADACDIGALGFLDETKHRGLTAHLPFAELPKSYQDKRRLVPPVMGFWRIRPEATYRAAYRLLTVPANDPYEAFEAVGREALAVRPGNFSLAASVARQAQAVAGPPRGRTFFPGPRPARRRRHLYLCSDLRA